MSLSIFAFLLVGSLNLKTQNHALEITEEWTTFAAAENTQGKTMKKTSLKSHCEESFPCDEKALRMWRIEG